MKNRLNDTFNTQAMIDAINKVKSVSNSGNVVAYGGCELPVHIKEIFELYNIKYKKPTSYFGLDDDKGTIYIVPKRITDIEILRGRYFLNED